MPLHGEDYPLEYYEDGYPKLPACLDRRAARGQSNVEDDNDESKYQRPPKQRHGSSSGFMKGGDPDSPPPFKVVQSLRPTGGIRTRAYC